MLKTQIEQDLKVALLAGNKTQATTLRSIKSAILYAEVAQGARGTGLTDVAIVEVLTKEAKKRQESADMYRQGGDEERAQAELTEKAVIENYLPQQLDDSALAEIVEAEIAAQGADSVQAMGKVIAAVKQQTAGRADGGRIAKMVQERIKSQ